MEWIKCSERLPEDDKYVLVWDGNINLDNFPFYEIAAYRTFNNGSFFISGPYVLQKITHWMPLPNPPQE
jgi:hypothetical protein